jgi:TM2 domain-containing membrane protein YozV
MASWWEYLLFYLGFKRKQKQIERAQQPEGMTDEKSLTGEQTIPPEKSHVFQYELNVPTTMTVDVESISGHVLDVSVVDKQNLARMSPDAVSSVETAIRAITDGTERLHGELPAGEWAVVVYNTNERESASAYLRVQIGGGRTASGGVRSGDRSPFLAGILSFFVPGAGQLYNRQLLRAVAGFFLVPIAYFVSIGIAAAVDLSVVVILGLLVHGGVIYDAYNESTGV